MKLFLCTFFTITWAIASFAQLPHLHVEGLSQFRGRLDINHMDDTSTVLIGRNAGIGMTFLFNHHNTMVGSNAGRENTSSSDNSFFGSSAGQNTQAEGNSFFGSQAGKNNNSGYENSFFGYESGKENGGGSRNTFLGFQAGKNYHDFASNTFVGQSAGNNGSGSHNTFIGVLSGFENASDTLSKAIAIGYKAKVNCSNCAIIGGTGSDTVKVGIGVTDPTHTLDIDGNARIRQVPTIPAITNGTERVLLINTNGTLVKAISGTVSDRRLKEDIRELHGALEQVTKLSGYSYYLRSDATQTRQIGVTAQELEKAFPELVKEDPETGYKSVQYPQITAVLLQAIKEQQQQIDLLDARMKLLETNK